MAGHAPPISPPGSPLARQASHAPLRSRRSTPLAARGEPVVWLTGMAMVVCVCMIVSLLALIVIEGGTTFWPRPIDTITLRNGSVFMGVPVREETYDPSPTELAAIAALRASGAPLRDHAFEPGGRPIRRLYRTGNKELRGQAFEWAPIYTIAATRRDPGATYLERQEWGVFVGKPEAIVHRSTDTPAKDGQPVNMLIAEGSGLSRAFTDLHAQATDRRRQVEYLKRVEVGAVNARMERARLDFRQTEIDERRTTERASSPAHLGVVPWSVLVGAGLLACLAAILLPRKGKIRRPPSRARSFAHAALWLLAAVIALPVWLLSPWSERGVSPAQLESARLLHESRLTALDLEYKAILARISDIESADASERLVIRDVQLGRFAPTRQTEPDEPMRISQVVRWIEPNQLSLWGKLAVYADRWREFLLDEPREANTEGGIFPVIFGTVLLTLLLSVAVVPLGVVAALYMREYARQGFLISAVRVAVNNLAGVPSIVYGVFGLGFFCYTVGGFLDAGPVASIPAGSWWPGVVAILLASLAAAGLAIAGGPSAGMARTRGQVALAAAGGLAWLACIIGAIVLIVRTPYFHGFYQARLPSPTFGARGLLWAALTLALLTLPVVIVATEEAIAAVPRTMREGSYGCGAGKWQTIRRIILPRAMPGIMTGMILAMARGAGEVAPLMLVGAVKLAPELPVSRHWPFLHLDRSFMHLGFHIYDVGFQSPDAEAARPIVWSTTLVLVGLVLLLNLAAIRLRTRLRRRFVGGAF